MGRCASHENNIFCFWFCDFIFFYFLFVVIRLPFSILFTVFLHTRDIYYKLSEVDIFMIIAGNFFTFCSVWYFVFRSETSSPLSLSSFLIHFQVYRCSSMWFRISHIFIYSPMLGITHVQKNISCILEYIEKRDNVKLKNFQKKSA